MLALSASLALAQGECKRTGLINVHRNHLAVRIPPSSATSPLPPGPQGLQERMRTLQFASGSGAYLSIEEYARRNCVTSLLVAKDGRLVFERYYQGTRADDRLYSASMAKTLAAVMVGILVHEGQLALSATVKDTLPGFDASAFADDTVEDLLRMTSAAALKDCYSDTACSQGDNQLLNVQISPAADTAGYLRSKTERSAPPGARFFYSGAQTALLGLMVHRLSESRPERLWQTRIWEPIGAEHDAYWIVNNRGELGYQCCYNAAARDWLRLGIMLAQEGEIEGRRVLPAEVVRRMHSANPAKAQPLQGGRYGLQVWIPTYTPKGTQRTMELRGSYGQFLVIDPEQRLVILHTGNARSEQFPFPDWPRLRHRIQAEFSR